MQPSLEETIASDSTEKNEFSGLTPHERKLRAEAIISLVRSETNTSIRSMEKIIQAFKVVDPYSKVLSDVELERTKLTYITDYGIESYCKSRLKEMLYRADGVVVYLDTATFKQLSSETGSISKNLDLVVRFHNEASQRIECHYLDTAQLYSETADIQLEVLMKVCEDFDILHKVMQAGLDGPNVNKKLVKLFQQKHKEMFKDASMFIDLGSCNIHPAHNAFKAFTKAVEGVNISQLLNCLHSIFKLSTVRRKRYADICLELIGKIEFFLRHVASRWLTAGPAISRVIFHFEALQEFLRTMPEYEPAMVKENKEVYRVLNEFFLCEEADENLVKLYFIEYVAGIHEEYCLKLQTESPVIPFLQEESLYLFKRILGIVCNTADIPSHPKNIVSLKLEEFADDSKRRKKPLDAGGYLLKELPKYPALQKNLRKAVIADAKHLQKHLNLDNDYQIQVSAFDPKNREETKTKRYMTELGSKLLNKTENKKLSAQIDAYIIVADVAPYTNNKNNRLDRDFYPEVFEAMTRNLGYKPVEFIKLTKLVLSLSHGQASIERSFR